MSRWEERAGLAWESGWRMISGETRVDSLTPHGEELMEAVQGLMDVVALEQTTGRAHPRREVALAALEALLARGKGAGGA